MKLSCDEFNLGGGDSLRVQRGKKKQLFKGKVAPNLKTNGKVMKLFFKSNKKNHGTGASCTITC